MYFQFSILALLKSEKWEISHRPSTARPPYLWRCWGPPRRRPRCRWLWWGRRRKPSRSAESSARTGPPPSRRSRSYQPTFKNIFTIKIFLLDKIFLFDKVLLPNKYFCFIIFCLSTIYFFAPRPWWTLSWRRRCPSPPPCAECVASPDLQVAACVRKHLL